MMTVPIGICIFSFFDLKKQSWELQANANTDEKVNDTAVGSWKNTYPGLITTKNFIMR